MPELIGDSRASAIECIMFDDVAHTSPKRQRDAAQCGEMIAATLAGALVLRYAALDTNPTRKRGATPAVLRWLFGLVWRLDPTRRYSARSAKSAIWQKRA